MLTAPGDQSGQVATNQITSLTPRTHAACNLFALIMAAVGSDVKARHTKWAVLFVLLLHSHAQLLLLFICYPEGERGVDRGDICTEDLNVLFTLWKSPEERISIKT